MKFSAGDFVYHLKHGKLEITFVCSYDEGNTWFYYTEIGDFQEDELLTETEYLWTQELHRYFGLEHVS